jgi:hypothetical protein
LIYADFKCANQLINVFCGLFSRGLRKMVFKNFKYASEEMYRGFSMSATVKQLQKFVPSLSVADVARYI